MIFLEAGNGKRSRWLNEPLAKSSDIYLVTSPKTHPWENIIKHGFFIGPSQCSLCRQQEESLGHLFYLSLPYSLNPLGWSCEDLSTNLSSKGRPGNTIVNWREDPFQSVLLNWIWKLLPSFLLWEIWMDINCIIFQGKHRGDAAIGLAIKHNIF